MNAVLIAITSAWRSLSSAVLGGVGFVATTVGGWFLSVGRKFLSFEWVKRICEFCKKVYDALKKTVFNPKVVKIANIVLSLALFGLAVTQLVFAMIALITGASTALTGTAEAIVFFVLNVLSAGVCVLFLLSFVLGLFKKTFRYGFVGAFIFSYVIAMMSANFTGAVLYQDLAENVFGLKIAAIVVFAVLAVLKLTDEKKPTSVFAFFLCILSAVTVVLLYQAGGFGNIASYDFGQEFHRSAEGVGFIAYFRHISEYFSGTAEGGDVARAIMLQSLSLADTSGKFAAAFAATGNGLICFICSLAPYVLLTTLAGFFMGTLNDRLAQTVYLSKTLKTLKYLFFGILIAFLAALVIQPIFEKGQIALIPNVGAALAALISVATLAAASALSRKMITEKYARKLKIKEKLA